MTRAAVSIPDESALLCEGCGYTLSGLPVDSMCPECGKPIPESAPELRNASAWEQRNQWLRTTLMVLFQPARFYRTLATRATGGAAWEFAMSHWIISSILLLTAAQIHSHLVGFRWHLAPVVYVLLPLLLWLITRFAAKLTHWEATYRGLRMPFSVVLRAMYYHAAHYVPVALVALLTVLAYRWMLRSNMLGPDTILIYLYVICGEVVLGAIYLFKTYWIGMRNIMYANR